MKNRVAPSGTGSAENAIRREEECPDPILPDVLRSGLDLVFCGTAPSRASAASRAYYAHPGNVFWRMINEVGLTQRKLRAEEFHNLPRYGIGLTDLAKFHFGNDHELPFAAFDTSAFHDKILGYTPRWVAFTSKTAAQAYAGCSLQFGLQSWRIGSTQIFVLPSPSGRARRTWNPALWLELAVRVRSP